MATTTTGLEITVPEPADGPSILAIACKIPLFDPGDQSVIEELWTEFTAKGDAQSWYHFLVARRGEALLGFACYGQRALTDGCYDLYWIAIDPAHQGEKLGLALIRAVEIQIRKRGGRLVIAETAGKPAFEATRRFYLAVGYELEARVRDFYSPGDDLVIFTKRL